VVPTTNFNGNNSLKYTNNGFTPGTTTLDCSANQLWVQRLALEYLLEFAECNPLGVTTPTALMRATAGGKVADVKAAVDAFLASNTPVPTDLITIMVGTNDIVELYNSVSTSALTQAAAVAEVKRRADVFAAQVDRLTNRDNSLGRVMYSTVPDVNSTPFGRSKSSADQTLLKLLTDNFNNEMRLQVYDNGRSRGFLKTDQLFRNVISSVDSGDQSTGIINDSSPVCNNITDLQNFTDVLGCDTNKLVSGGTFNNYLWADGIHFSYAAHDFLATNAVDLARSLPW
jgi:lysophospholipase L1-like esterase